MKSEAIRVTALTCGHTQPSSRFRVRQHLESLRDLGVDIVEQIPAISRYRRIPGWPHKLRQAYSGPGLVAWNALKLAASVPGIAASRRHQVTWLQRALLPGLPSLEGLLKRPFVFDFDDALWQVPPLGARCLRSIARRAGVVVAGNRYLAEYVEPYCDQVQVIPTAIDTARFQPVAASDRPFTIGWTGVSTNLPYLEAIAPVLHRFLADHSDARLLVMADAPPRRPFVNPQQFEFRKWSEEVEVTAVQDMDVGLMPLPDNSWTRGKCSFKMLQSMACGAPVVVSPVGMNREILKLGDVGIGASSCDEWYQALEVFYRDRDHARRIGSEGRAVVLANFDRDQISRQLAEVFQTVASRSSG